MSGDRERRESQQFVASPRHGTKFHRGTRETGAECGQVADRWCDLNAENPLMVVVRYARDPCLSCIESHTSGLHALNLADHSAYTMHYPREDIIDDLPWEEHNAE